MADVPNSQVIPVLVLWSYQGAHLLYYGWWVGKILRDPDDSAT